MTVAAATDTSAISSSTTSSLSRSKMAQNFDTFLVMLTTQLKHQDPLSPMDSTEFTNQLVQFANVEQQINANSNLEKLIKVGQINQTASAISYIGQTIEADSSLVPLQGGTEEQTRTLKLADGTANFSYQLSDPAESVLLKIKDADGNVVRTYTGTGSVGKRDILWDGKDGDGNLLDDGTYTIEPEALDADGNALAVKTYAINRTSNASFSYTLANEALTAKIMIKDLDGNTIRELDGKGDKGRHEVTWDGKNSNGKTMADGAYAVEVIASTNDNKAVDAGITVYGRVTDVASDATNGTLLNMSGVVTTLDKVLTVRETASVQSDSSTN